MLVPATWFTQPWHTFAATIRLCFLIHARNLYHGVTRAPQPMVRRWWPCSSGRSSVCIGVWSCSVRLPTDRWRIQKRSTREQYKAAPMMASKLSNLTTDVSLESRRWLRWIGGNMLWEKEGVWKRMSIYAYLKETRWGNGADTVGEEAQVCFDFQTHLMDLK